MKRFKRYGLIALILLAVAALVYVLFIRPAPSADYNVNLLENGSFSALDKDGNPLHWYRDAYAGLSGSVFNVTADDDGNAAHIVNQMPKDARFAQDVAVEPNTLYRLRGWIKADAEGGRGANLSIAGGYYFSDQVYDSDGEWQEVVLYGRTGENQKEVTVYVRLGGYSGEATGEAWFRDVSLCKVSGVPEGYYASDWYDVFSGSSGSSDGDEGTPASLLLTVVSVAYVAFFIFLCRFLRRPRIENLKKKKESRGNVWLAVILLLCAFAARLFIANQISGYDVDIGCFRAWAEKMASVGPAGFYPANDPFSYCDYPPGYIWILGLLGWIGRLTGTGVTEFMVKLPPIAADVTLSALIYVYAKKYLSSPAALALSLLYAFNPLILVTGSAWGQADALMTLLLFLVVVYAVQGKWKAVFPLYIAAVLFKPQALMFGPLGLIALVTDILNASGDKGAFTKKIKDVLLGIGLMIVTALVIVVPFSIHLSWNWLFTLYSQTMGRYAYATVNSCNLYFLLGKNWVSAGSNISGNLWIPGLAYLLTLLPLICCWLHRRPANGLFTDKAGRSLAIYLGVIFLAAAFGLIGLISLGLLTYSTLGTAMIILSLALIAVLYFHGHDANNLPVFGAALLLTLFNVGPMMHERYLFPAVALLLLGYLLKKDVRILWLAVGVSIAGFLNVGCVLDRNIRIGGAAGHLSAPAISLNSDMAILEYLSAALNCAVCFASLWLCADLSRGHVLELAPEVKDNAPLEQNPPLRKMTLRDWIILSSITVVYAFVTFTNLGATKSPQTAYVSVSPDEQIVMDLGEERDFQILYFGGIHQYDSDFTVEISADGEHYDAYYTAGMKIGDCFKWMYLSAYSSGTYPVTLHGRYVRLTADHYNLTLFEILFRDAETGESIPAKVISDAEVVIEWAEDPETGDLLYSETTGEPITAVSATALGNETALNLTDEPDSMEGDYPSWYNSTYFDEIYHARTAYEHLHQMQPYEYTHPPLGKVMMSWAIAIFGMTPFGWRFAGALAGVLMLPGMYLLGKLFIKRSWGGMAAALLMAFDLMHFTQTRIATIDSFVVLWIIWMFYFMFRWFWQDHFHLPFWKSLVPLGLSGLCMGLGVASKWTACYAGVALALIFFFGIWKQARLVFAAGSVPVKKRTADEKIMAESGKRLVKTVASCLIFFVLVPLVIYFCAYIPFFAYDGVGVSVKKIINETGRMYSYHAQPGLGMDHSFYSPWYEWPVIAKPMWYSSNAFEPEGYEMSIAALGNPALWWTGLLCIVLLAGVWVRRHLRKDGSFALRTENTDHRPALILLCYFVQLLPWILVPRGTYIYHYFPCVPFLCLSIPLCLDLLADQGRQRALAAEDEAAAVQIQKRWEITAMALLAVVLLASVVLFIAFFPYASGALTPQSWMEAMRWFSRWLWY